MTQLNPLHNSTWRLFLTAHVKLLDRIEAQLTAANLPSLEWYDVLFTLKEAPDQRLRLSELADQVLLSRSNLTRLVDRLESAELIQRERCSNDRRGAFAVLTQSGVEMQQKMWKVYSKAIADFFGTHLSLEESQIMQQALMRMLVALNEQ
jgi:DNA-binding MarR family transcriptional regulator